MLKCSREQAEKGVEMGSAARQPAFKSWFHYGLVVGQVTYPLVASVSSTVKWGQ